MSNVDNIKVYSKEGLTMFQGARLVGMQEGMFGMLRFEGGEGEYYLIHKDNISAIMVTPSEEETNE